MITMKEIADQAGVSRATVDRVLNNRGLVKPEKEKLILKIAKELGYQPNIAGKGLAAKKKKLKFVFYYPNLTLAPFYVDVVKGARKEAENLKQYGVTVCFAEIPTGNMTELKYPSNFQSDFGKIDGLISIGGNVENTKSSLVQLEKQGIPVVLYNMDCENQHRLAVVKCDYIKSGRLAAGLAAALTNKKGHIAIFSLDNGSIPSFSDRLTGFQKELQEHYPEMKIVTVSNSGYEMPADYFYRNTQSIIRDNKDINVAYVVNPSDYKICRILRSCAKDRDLKIISNDLVQGQREMVRNGAIDVTICQEPEKQGSLPLQILFNYLALGIKPEQDIFYTQLSIHISQNV